MSQDGRGQLIPRSVFGSPTPELIVSCGGLVRDSGRNRYGTCSRGCTHCLNCSGPARRHGRDWVCVRQCWKVK